MSESNNLPQAISHKQLSYLMLKAQKDSHFSDKLAEIDSPEKKANAKKTSSFMLLLLSPEQVCISLSLYKLALIENKRNNLM